MRRLRLGLGGVPARGARPRRPRRRRWVRPLARYGGAALGLALIAATVTWLWQSGRVGAALNSARATVAQASAAAGLTVREVYVAGRDRTARAAIVEALGVERGAPLLALDPQAARRRLETLGWVSKAVVQRRFPGTVFVRIEEREPLALWQRDGELTVVDRRGAVIDGASPERFSEMLLVVGDEAPNHAAELHAVMASEPALRERVRAAVRVGERRWDLRLDNGVTIKLPDSGVAEAWHRLATYQRRYRLLARDIVAVDLRLSDRLVVRRAPDAADGDDGGTDT